MDGTKPTEKKGRRWPWSKKTDDMKPKSVAKGAPKKKAGTANSARKSTLVKSVSDSVPSVIQSKTAGSKELTSNSNRKSTLGKPVAKKPRASFLCRTKAFRHLCDSVFDNIDTDGSGSVDEKELYSGLLLIHLQLGMYLGPAACKPLAREKCHNIFEKMDADDSGSLDREEFRHVMMVLFGNVFVRVMVQWSMTIILVPMVAKQLWNGLLSCIDTMYQIITNLDEYSSLAHWIETSIEEVRDYLLSFISDPVLLVFAEIGDKLAEIPDSVWDALPLTILTVVLSIIVVPYIIFKVDDFFQWIVDPDHQKNNAALQKKREEQKKHLKKMQQASQPQEC